MGFAARFVVAVACLVLVLPFVQGAATPPAAAEMGGRTETIERHGDRDEQFMRMWRMLPPADRPPLAELAELAERAEPAKIAPNRTDLRLTGTAEDDPADAVAAAREVEGVAAAAAVRVASVPLGVGEDEEVTVGIVDPEGFRPFTPEVTADAEGVWERIADGDAAFTHDVGNHLEVEHEIELGERVPLALEDPGDATLRIGAYASNGVPPVAEAIVSSETGEALGLDGDLVVLVALEEGASTRATASALEDATGLEGEDVPEPETRRAFLSDDETRAAFEPFDYVSLGDGMIRIDPDWVERNITRAEVPILRGEVVCHRKMIPQLRGALEEIEDQGLAHLIDTSDYGGCWVPRHILFNPNRGLSMHAWGLAIDFNVQTNQYGAEPQMDMRIVEIFERWGFEWGGRWSTPDGMHFELSVLMEGID